METLDFAVIGAGIAGASVAWELAQNARVLLLEREAQPGYHTTGRSAALYMETYGTPRIRALTRASRAFLDQPPPGFADSPILSPRGVLYIAGPDQMDLLEAAWQELHTHSPSLRRLSPAELVERAPCLRLEALGGGLAESGAADIDVNGLHQGYLHGLRKQGGTVRMNAEVTALSRADGVWTVQLQDGSSVQTRTVVNAAGAWADVVGQLAGAAPIGLTPCRRTAFTFPAPEGLDLPSLPAIIAVDESFYIKPDARQLLGSPANADPMYPHDVVPEEIDVATGIWHIEQMTTFQIRRPSHTWAGLRSFVSDGDMVIGWDGQVDGLFWVAAQGGYGIQSAPGYALLARNLLLGEPLDASLVAEGVDAEGLSPRRLR
ncbi:NAD(P)/FAD-dependent oxidoreductase [Simplicispira sedimenti]|uniref:NAD(P)/FAD-dependent oxidoreductase n=1 Tax=Simplicispira sedimenti TaxID=2919500 RepID=UPI001FA9ED5F|nr:FAD-dependent oxidoreductase [Acidovorax sp. W1-6]